jgi:hypothetical protein
VNHDSLRGKPLAKIPDDIAVDFDHIQTVHAPSSGAVNAASLGVSIIVRAFRPDAMSAARLQPDLQKILPKAFAWRMHGGTGCDTTVQTNPRSGSRQS